MLHEIVGNLEPPKPPGCIHPAVVQWGCLSHATACRGANSKFSRHATVDAGRVSNLRNSDENEYLMMIGSDRTRKFASSKCDWKKAKIAAAAVLEKDFEL